MGGLTHLRSSVYRSVPWKNGGGITAEIAVSPAGATLHSGFDWRLSMATVASSGPFSPFPGYDRILVQLAGQPMLLRHQGHAAAVTLAPFVPYQFSGDVETSGQITGPTLDLNCIVRRAAFSASCCVLSLGSEQVVDVAEVAVCLLFVAVGDLTCSYGPQRYRLAERDVLVMVNDAREAAALRVESAGGRAVALRFDLNHRAR